MTSPLSFSSRLCFKLWKGCCTVVNACWHVFFLLCTGKVCRWKFFHRLCGFVWQFTWAYLSVKWVINPLTSHTTSFFLSSSTSSLTTFVCETFLNWICQHWLSYNKLSSNNINNNNNNVSVIQVHVSELTAHRALILYNVYIAALILAAVDVDSVLFVDQQQLTQYTHFSQTRVILVLLSVNVLFVQLHITLNQMRTHQLLYINTILIQSQSVLVSADCVNCQTCGMTLFLKCHCTLKHFSECCDNCKWRDHACCCFICNNDILIVISDNKNNNNDVNESEPAAQLRRITLTSLLMRAVIIYVTP